MSAYREEQNVLLTTQEKNVLKLVAEANTNKEIAAALGISPSTVKRHMENILSKLRLRNRIEAAVYAVRAGYLLSYGKQANWAARTGGVNAPSGK